MTKAKHNPSTITPRFDAQFLPAPEDIVAIIERQPGETLEVARADFARMLGLTAQVNALVDELAVAAADPATSVLEKQHLQLALLMEFAEFCAGGSVQAHQPLRELLAESQERLRSGS